MRSSSGKDRLQNGIVPNPADKTKQENNMNESTAENTSVASAVSTQSAADSGSVAASANAGTDSGQRAASKPRTSKRKNEATVTEALSQAEHADGTTATKAFSQRLNAMSRQRAEAVRKEYEGHEQLLSALRQAGYEGGAEEIAQRFLAGQNTDGKTETETDPTEKGIGEGKASGESKSSMDADSRQTLRWAQTIIDDRTFERDLQEIKAVYPDVKCGNVWELGEVYLRLMLTGEVDAVTAYEAQTASERRGRKAAPPSAGSARSGGMAPEKEFYTPEEVDRLSKNDYDNPKIMARVRKSMTRWR